MRLHIGLVSACTISHLVDAQISNEKLEGSQLLATTCETCQQC